MSTIANGVRAGDTAMNPDDEDDRLIPSPMCIYDNKHCGAKALLDEPEDCGNCINAELTCLRCGVRGVLSVRKDLLEGVTQ
jgi:hypothetical protein